jgi:hypothetical protein
MPEQKDLVATKKKGLLREPDLSKLLRGNLIAAGLV